MSSSEVNGSWFDLTTRILNSENRYNLTILNDEDSEDDMVGRSAMVLMNRNDGVYISEYLQDGASSEGEASYSIKDVTCIMPIILLLEKLILRTGPLILP